MAKKRKKKSTSTGRVTVSKGLLAKATAALAAVKRTVKAAPARKARKKTRRKSR
jgi:post-segregation antitoxin (ccd killing protein)